MSKTEIETIQRALNIIRAELKQADTKARLQALELMAATSQSVIAAARKLTKPEMVFPKPKPMPIPKPKKQLTKPASSTSTPQPKPNLSPKKPIPPVC